MPDQTAIFPISKLDIIRSTTALGTTLSILFILCWAIAAGSGVRFSHMFVELFTMAPPRSGAALGEGLLWSFLTGALVGALGSIFYNLFAFLGRR